MNLTEFKRSKKSDYPFYLLFGHPVGHSWSPMMHNVALDYHGIEAEYHAINLQKNELAALAPFLNDDNFLGANVTIPYKQIIMQYVDHVDQTAETIGAINTVVKQNFRLTGYNTDFYGFLEPLHEFEFALAGNGAIIFGTGGAARAITVALIDFGVERIYLVSRNPAKINSFNDFEQAQIISYDNWTSFVDETTLIVNATPLGMHPKVNESPVRDAEIQWLADHICYDIVYNPTKTLFLKQAEKAGAKTIGGIEMLIHQASRSFKLWTGKKFPTELVRERLHEKLAD